MIIAEHSEANNCVLQDQQSHLAFIRELIDSLCRDGKVTPYMQYKINASK